MEQKGGVLGLAYQLVPSFGPLWTICGYAIRTQIAAEFSVKVKKLMALT
jgi:hypothetical protein